MNVSPPSALIIFVPAVSSPLINKSIVAAPLTLSVSIMMTSSPERTPIAELQEATPLQLL